MFVFPDWMIDNWMLICITAASAPFASLLLLAIVFRDQFSANGARVGAMFGGSMAVLFVAWVVYTLVSQKAFIKYPPVLVVMGFVFIADCASLAAVSGAAIGFTLRLLRPIFQPHLVSIAGAGTEAAADIAKNPYAPPACSPCKANPVTAESDNHRSG